MMFKPLACWLAQKVLTFQLIVKATIVMCRVSKSEKFRINKINVCYIIVLSAYCYEM